MITSEKEFINQFIEYGYYSSDFFINKPKFVRTKSGEVCLVVNDNFGHSCIEETSRFIIALSFENKFSCRLNSKIIWDTDIDGNYRFSEK